MNISLSWLRDYIETDLTADEIAKILTSIGLEVGHISEFESIKGGLEGLVVGEVKTCAKHENSDHLHVTTVDVGAGEPLQIVCGAANIAQGQKVVVATVGTKLYGGDESFTIKRSKIRGVESFGMICAEDEIGVGKSHDGIIVLPSETAVGTLAKDYYRVETDTVIEVDITPNRSDAISHYGVARDLYAYCFAHGIAAELRRPQLDESIVALKGNNNPKIEVRVDNSDACPRYAGISLTGVGVDQSPQWLQNRLLAIGLSPINNVVDITNYMLHSFGQPLHAFDADRIAGHKIIVRNAVEGEKFVTLDGVEHTLTKADLMICDADKPMCLAGIFGGLHSGVSQDTKSVFIESAYFDPVGTRKSARYHGLNTDSSFRFERGVNPHDTIYVLGIAASMIARITGATVASDIVDIYPKTINDFEVCVLLAKIRSLVGKDIDTQTIETILEGLEIAIVSKDTASDDTVYRLRVPAYRTDVRRDVDVIEDIMRIYGYNNIEFSQSAKIPVSYRTKPDRHYLQNIISEQLTANGFYEIMNNSFSKSQYYDCLTTYPSGNSVSVMNALSSDLNVMRQTLLFGGLESLAYNINRQNADLKFYEFGNCYRYVAEAPKESDPLAAYSQSEHLGLWITGRRLPQSWLRKDEATSVYDLKAYVHNILIRLGIGKLSVREFDSDIYSQALELATSSGKPLAVLGVVSKGILKTFDIKEDVFFADIFWDEALAESVRHTVHLTEIPKFPEVSRDLALLLDKNITFSQVENIAYNVERKLLRRVTLFDVYEGKNLEEGKKSYAVNFILQDSDKTLTDRQIETIMSKLQKAFSTELGARIR